MGGFSSVYVLQCYCLAKPKLSSAVSTTPGLHAACMISLARHPAACQGKTHCQNSFHQVSYPSSASFFPFAPCPKIWLVLTAGRVHLLEQDLCLSTSSLIYCVGKLRALAHKGLGRTTGMFSHSLPRINSQSSTQSNAAWWTISKLLKSSLA